MSCGSNQFQIIMLLRLVLFFPLYTTILLQYSYAFSSLANNTNQHFVENKNSTFVILDQHSAYAVMDLTLSSDERSHQVTLRLGPHAQEYSFLLDTGSVLTWVNCEAQSSYHYPHQPYNPPVRNPVFCSDPICHLVQHPKENPCHRTNDRCFYQLKYVDKTSITGELIVDSLAIPFVNAGLHLGHPSIKIGCALKNVHPPQTTIQGRLDYDGIIGLGKNSGSSIINQLSKKGITQPVFGHCMARASGGHFFIGAGKPLPHSITWAQMATLHNPLDYSPGKADLHFGGTSAAKNLEITFDSGATSSYFKRTALNALVRRLRANILGKPLKEVQQSDYPICWRGTGPIRSVDQVAAYFKTMSLVFHTANEPFELPPYTFLTLMDTEDHPPTRYVCLNIFDGAEVGLGKLNLIGANFFQNKLVVYDLHRKMIGWAPSNCNDKGANYRKNHHVADRGNRRRYLPIHHFSSHIRERLQPPLANYTSKHQKMN